MRATPLPLCCLLTLVWSCAASTKGGSSTSSSGGGTSGSTGSVCSPDPAGSATVTGTNPEAVAVADYRPEFSGDGGGRVVLLNSPLLCNTQYCPPAGLAAGTFDTWILDLGRAGIPAGKSGLDAGALLGTWRITGEFNDQTVASGVGGGVCNALTPNPGTVTISLSTPTELKGSFSFSWGPADGGMPDTVGTFDAIPACASCPPSL